MGVGSFIPQVWSAQVLGDLLDSLVYGQVANRDYQGEITQAGDVVKINEIGDITIRDYTRNSTSALTLEYLSDAQKELKVDQQKYFAFEVDDVDAAQARGNYMTEAMRKAAWGLGNAIDEYIAAMHSQAGITLGTTAAGKHVTSSNVTKYIAEIGSRLDAANVPTMGRWIVGPPWFVMALYAAGVNKDTDNSRALQMGPGYYAQFMGFNIFSSNNVVNGAYTDGAKIMAGYSGTISLAVQILNTEAFRSTDRFTDVVRGLAVFGAKVVRPTTLYCLSADYDAETT